MENLLDLQVRAKIVNLYGSTNKTEDLNRVLAKLDNNVISVQPMGGARFLILYRL